MSGAPRGGPVRRPLALLAAIAFLTCWIGFVVTTVGQGGARTQLVPSTLSAVFWLGAGSMWIAWSLLVLAGHAPRPRSQTPLGTLFRAANPSPRLRLTLPQPLGPLSLGLAMLGPPLVRLTGVQRLYALDVPLLLFFFLFSLLAFLNGPGGFHRGRLNLCLWRWTAWLGAILVAAASLLGTLACLGLI